jgi:hypothetical protein
VINYLDSHPGDAEAAIATRAAVLEFSGKQEQACRMLAEKFAIPIPAPMAAGMPRRDSGENVPEDPLAAAKYHMNLGNDITVRRLAAEVLKSGDREQRNESLLLISQLEMRAANWSVALRSLLDYLHASGQL